MLFHVQSYLENTVVSILLLGQNPEGLLFITRGDDAIRDLRMIDRGWKCRKHTGQSYNKPGKPYLSGYDLGSGDITHVRQSDEVTEGGHPV